jgi:PPK2 family polyphosphate:nucleotide phosphotransferase
MADIEKRIARFIEPFRVAPDSSVKLAKDFDPAFEAGVNKKSDGVELLKGGIELISEYQARLAAQDTYGVLVVLQALDAAGKDGTIRHVMSGVNPQGVRVESFKIPSARELDQDFLRRYQERLPSRGEIAIFNRSHYEEVLVVRVHPENLVRQKLPAETRGHDIWKRRYEAINDWERYLSGNGFRIVKIFLNLSKEEQRVRFLRRIDLPEHHWKFSSHDVEERRSWDAYQEAFSEMLSHTSTEWAPWYVIPADRKWFARIAAAAQVSEVKVRGWDPVKKEPIIRLFDRAPLIRPILFKTLVYWVIVFIARLLERFVHFSVLEGHSPGDFPVHLVTTFSWHRFLAISLWLLVLFFIYVTALEFSQLFGRGEIRRLMFTARPSRNRGGRATRSPA